MLSFSAVMASSVRNPSSVCCLTPLLSKHLNVVLDTACLTTFTFAGKCAHLSSSRSCFFFLLCEATNFFFLRTRIKSATLPVALKPNTVIARAYAHKQPCSNCSNEKTERQLFSRCPARKQKICFTSPPAPLYNCLCLSTQYQQVRTRVTRTHHSISWFSLLTTL